MTYYDETYYYITNLQGDVIGIADSTGALVVRYSYDAWGKLLSITGSMADTLGVQNPLRYRGYVYDQETGLYYLQSRYYDPEIGRFINADALIATSQGLLGNNIFAYCNNNPVIFEDTSGHAFKPCIEIINDGAGGDYGPIGTIGSDYYSGSSENSILAWCVNAYNYITNDDISVAEANLNKYGFTFYKGTPVFTADLPKTSACSYGVIVMDPAYLKEYRHAFADTLKHEYGHAVHMKQVGIVTYTTQAAIPSLISAAIADPDAAGFRGWMSQNYHSLPWERIADQLGEVSGNTYLSGANALGSLYYGYTLLTSTVLKIVCGGA
ncbi:MAG: RHS repeat-associated core domain-containing protein [Ruminococcaceae bacterium]|nr:RHS repeat-associated core domain-containing protein [Oscillospiraceae bacterium]